MWEKTDVIVCDFHHPLVSWELTHGITIQEYNGFLNDVKILFWTDCLSYLLVSPGASSLHETNEGTAEVKLSIV